VGRHTTRERWPPPRKSLILAALSMQHRCRHYRSHGAHPSSRVKWVATHEKFSSQSRSCRANVLVFLLQSFRSVRSICYLRRGRCNPLDGQSYFRIWPTLRTRSLRNHFTSVVQHAGACGCSARIETLHVGTRPPACVLTESPSSSAPRSATVSTPVRFGGAPAGSHIFASGYLLVLLLGLRPSCFPDAQSHSVDSAL